MRARSSAILAISVLTVACVAGIANAAPAMRCESAVPVSESVSDRQALSSASRAVDGSRSVRLLDRRSFSGGGQADPFEGHANDRVALDEMLLGSHATSLRWEHAPELIVLMPVLQYAKGSGTEYRATSERLTDEEATQLVADLTNALAVLTDNTFERFSNVRRELVSAGDVVNVMRPGQIVVARYDGVRDQLATIGFGGRSTRGSTVHAGSIILDNDYDRANDTRWLLRMHELGHALGYNHVLSRPSIMNPKIGPQPTDFDRTAARIAFQSSPSCFDLGS